MLPFIERMTSGIVIPLLVHGVMLLLLGLTVVRLLARRSAASRALVLRTAVFGLLLAPLLGVLVPAAPITVEDFVPGAHRLFTAPPAPGSTTPDAPLPGQRVTPTRVGDENHARDAVPSGALNGPWSVSGVVGLVWLLGAGLWLVRLGVQVIRLRAILSASIRAPVESAPHRVLESLLGAHAPRQRASVRLNRETVIPLVTGTVRPVIVLPADAVEWSDDRLRIVLLHELAHVRRGDFTTALMFELLVVIHWPNPLAWMARRDARLAMEMAADAFVLGSGVDRFRYADELMRFARGALAHLRPAHGLGGATSGLARRVRSILARETPLGEPRRSRARLVEVSGLLLVTGLVSLPLARPMPSARVSMEANPAIARARVAAVPQTVADQTLLLIDSLLRAEDPTDRRSVARRLEPTATIVVPRLVKMFEDTCSGNRWRAARGLRDLRTPTAVPDLVDLLLGDDHEAVRAMAINAIATSDARAGAALLRTALPGTSAGTRDHVTRAVATLRGSAVYSVFADAVRTPAPAANSSGT